MTDFDFKKFIKDSGHIKLEKSEKDRILHYLKALMMNEPVRGGGLAGHRLWSTSFYQLKLIFTKPMPIIILIAIILSGGTSLAAESSLPGDALYSIKVGVNENVRGWLALSDEAEASLQAALATERLKEAEKLAVKNRLTAETRVIIEQNFEEHASRVENRVDKFQAGNAKKALEVNSNFQTSLEAHLRILSDIGVSLDGETEEQLSELILKINPRKDGVIKSASENENEIRLEVDEPGVRQAAEGKAKASANKIEEVKKFIENLKNRFGAEDLAQAEARLELAQDTMFQGQAKLEAEAYGEAFVLFQKAHNIAQEVKLLLTAKVEFEDEETGSPVPTPTPVASQSTEPTVSVSPSVTPTPSTAVNSVNGSIKIENRTGADSDSDGVGASSRSRIKIDLSF